MFSDEDGKTKKNKKNKDARKEEKRAEKEIEDRIMEQLRQCYAEMAQASDPYPHAAVLADRKNGPGAIFDEMNREFIARGARKFTENPTEMQNNMFRWRRMLCMPPSSASTSTAEQYRHHYAIFDVTSTSLTSTWVRGVMLFFKKQLKTCWTSIERSSTGVFPSSMNGGVSSRAYHQSPHPQGYLTANSVDLLRDVVAAHFSSLSDGGSSTGGEPFDLLCCPDYLSALRLMPSLVNSFRLARNFCKTMLIAPAASSSFPSTSSATSTSASPFTSFGVQRNRYPGSYRYPFLAATASAPASYTVDAQSHSQSNHQSSVLNDQDRFYTDIIRSEFGNAEWLRYLLSMLLGALQLRHSNDKSGRVLAELCAARMGGGGGQSRNTGALSQCPTSTSSQSGNGTAGLTSNNKDRSFVSILIESMTSENASFSPNEIFMASQQLLQWATGVETSKQFTQLLALLFIQEQCHRYFPHDFYRDQIVTVQKRIEVLPLVGLTFGDTVVDTGKKVSEICGSKPFQEVIEFLCRHVPMYLEALEPLAAATQCHTHFTSVILLQLFCVQYPTEKDLSCPLWTSGAVQPVKSQRRGSVGSGGAPLLRVIPSSSVNGGGSSGTAAPQQRSPTLPSVHLGTVAHGASAAPTSSTPGSARAVCRPPIHAELPAEQTFLYHMYGTVLAPLLRVYLQVDAIAPYRSSLSTSIPTHPAPLQPDSSASISNTLIRLATTAPLFVIPVSTRLLRWRVLQLGDQPMSAYAIGVSAFQLAMGSVLHQIVGQLKGMLSVSNSTSKESASNVAPSVLEDQIVWLLGHVMRFDMALWALLEESTLNDTVKQFRSGKGKNEGKFFSAAEAEEGGDSSMGASYDVADPAAVGDVQPTSRRGPQLGLTALKEGMHHLYAAFHQCLSSLHSTATTLLSILLVNSIHQYLYKAEHTSTLESVVVGKKNGKGGAADSSAADTENAPVLDPASNRARRKKQSKERDSMMNNDGATEEIENDTNNINNLPAHRRKRRTARSRERNADVDGVPGHPSGRTPSSTNRKKRKFLGIVISREEELQSLLRLSRCAEADVFYEKYKDLLVSRLLYYPDPSSSRNINAVDPSVQRVENRGNIPVQSDSGTQGLPPTVTQHNGIEASARSDEETDALKRYWEGKSLEYLELVADGHEAFQSVYQVYHQFQPVYLRIPAQGPPEIPHPTTSREVSPSPSAPDTELVLSVMDWRQWNNADGTCAAVAENRATTSEGKNQLKDGEGALNAASVMGNSAPTPLPLPPELAPVLVEFDAHYGRASDQKKHLRFNYAAALSSFSVGVTLSLRPPLTPVSTRKSIRITVNTTLLIHRILLVIIAHKRRGITLGKLTECVNATLNESLKTQQKVSSTTPSSANTAPTSMDIKHVVDLLKSLIEKERLLQLRPPERTAPPSSADLLPEQSIALDYDYLQSVALEGVEHLECSHWPRPRLHTSPFEDQQTPPQLQAFRMEKIKIWVVQQLKQKKVLTHEELWSHFKRQREDHVTPPPSNILPLTFPVTSNLLKMAIEELIQKDLLKRSMSNPQQYEYNA